MVHLYEDEHVQENIAICQRLGVDFVVHTEKYSEYYLLMEGKNGQGS